ncbi:hypothetical protein [Dyadobacter sp. BHUBP1]|uniref:hypothetical protein n=1 Tax=Dyadobacter sp. BHUBP1 TaxID=3424178 RepID=UPI003D35827F
MAGDITGKGNEDQKEDWSTLSCRKRAGFTEPMSRWVSVNAYTTWAATSCKKKDSLVARKVRGCLSSIIRHANVEIKPLAMPNTDALSGIDKSSLRRSFEIPYTTDHRMPTR